MNNPIKTLQLGREVRFLLKIRSEVEDIMKGSMYDIEHKFIINKISKSFDMTIKFKKISEFKEDNFNN